MISLSPFLTLLPYCTNVTYECLMYAKLAQMRCLWDSYSSCYNQVVGLGRDKCAHLEPLHEAWTAPRPIESLVVCSFHHAAMNSPWETSTTLFIDSGEHLLFMKCLLVSTLCQNSPRTNNQAFIQSYEVWVLTLCPPSRGFIALNHSFFCCYCPTCLLLVVLGYGLAYLLWVMVGAIMT